MSQKDVGGQPRIDAGPLFFVGGGWGGSLVEMWGGITFVLILKPTPKRVGSKKDTPRRSSV